MSIFYWVVFSSVLGWIAFRLKVLTLDGAVGAFVMGVVIFATGSWKFITPLGVFMVLSSILSRVHRGAKESLETERLGRGPQRDLLQVYANGGVSLFVAIWWFYTPSPWLYLAYSAGIAAANGDTWATEIGLLSKSPPRNCVTFRVVEPGSSGGITLVGTLGAAAGSTVIALSVLPFLDIHPVTVVWVALAGFAASLLDSVLGATVQAVYRCKSCGKVTEASHHHGSEAVLVRGIRIITNDTVNFISSLAGAAVILLISILQASG